MGGGGTVLNRKTAEEEDSRKGKSDIRENDDESENRDREMEGGLLLRFSKSRENTRDRWMNAEQEHGYYR